MSDTPQQNCKGSLSSNVCSSVVEHWCLKLASFPDLPCFFLFFGLHVCSVYRRVARNGRVWECLSYACGHEVGNYTYTIWVSFSPVKRSTLDLRTQHEARLKPCDIVFKACFPVVFVFHDICKQFTSRLIVYIHSTSNAYIFWQGTCTCKHLQVAGLIEEVSCVCTVAVTTSIFILY